MIVNNRLPPPRLSRGPSLGTSRSRPADVASWLGSVRTPAGDNPEWATQAHVNYSGVSHQSRAMSGRPVTKPQRQSRLIDHAEQIQDNACCFDWS